MEKFRKILIKLLFPHIALFLFIVPIAAAALIYTFAFGSQDDIITYISYFLSAYALTIVCARAPRIIKGLCRLKTENKYVVRYTTDAGLRIKISLYCSLMVNILYAMLQLMSGFYYHSIWFYALSGYYALLAIVRFFLLKDVRRSALGEDRLSEFKRYRFCGIILLLVNMALAIIVTYIVWQNRGFAHNEILTIAMAAYTFFSMTMAVINVVKYRRHESPVMLAARSINLTAALVSILSLETAMLTAFGSSDDPQFRQIMTACTGSAICLIVLVMAIYMIVRSSKEIKIIKRGVPKHEQGKQ